MAASLQDSLFSDTPPKHFLVEDRSARGGALQKPLLQ
jgi:hypothetical protein